MTDATVTIDLDLDDGKEARNLSPPVPLTLDSAGRAHYLLGKETLLVEEATCKFAGGTNPTQLETCFRVTSSSPPILDAFSAEFSWTAAPSSPVKLGNVQLGTSSPYELAFSAPYNGGEQTRWLLAGVATPGVKLTIKVKRV